MDWRDVLRSRRWRYGDGLREHLLELLGALETAICRLLFLRLCPDRIVGNQGDDRLEGGSGYDRALGGMGADRLLGGSGSDILLGEADSDTLFAEDEVDEDQIYARGETQTATGLRRDWLDGGAGDDTLVGEAGDDVLLGGDGSDVLYGGAGVDILLGHLGSYAINADWCANVSRDPDTQGVLGRSFEKAALALGSNSAEDSAALCGGAGSFEAPERIDDGLTEICSQWGKVGHLINRIAVDTSAVATTATEAYSGVILGLSFAGVGRGTPGYYAWLDKLSLQERFNEQTFLPVPAQGSALAIDLYAEQYLVARSRRWWDGERGDIRSAENDAMFEMRSAGWTNTRR